MSRLRLIRGLLIAGVILGFGSGFASLRHRRHCKERPPANSTGERAAPPAPTPR
jgi:hypothetical protein